MATRLLSLALIALLLVACAKEPLLQKESYVFGTRVEVLIYGEEKDKAGAAAAEVLREFDRLHHAYHAWQPSELTALNEAIAAGRAHEISAELAALIRDAQSVAAKGDYLFDPGIGRLIGLWGFHSDEFKPRLPDAAKLKELAAAHASIADLTVVGNQECPPPGRPKEDTANDMESRRDEQSSPPSVGRGMRERSCVTSRNNSVALDFGGYLKGVALDRAASILKGRGINNALINIGGNVMALGAKGEKPWRVGIQHPRSTAPLATLDLKDGEAIGTSGDYQRYFELGGSRYSHLLDPRTGLPAQGTQAVTVLIAAGPQAGMLSDAASKPLFISGKDWREQATRLGIVEAMRIDAAGIIWVTQALNARLKMEAPDNKIVAVP